MVDPFPSCCGAYILHDVRPRWVDPNVPQEELTNAYMEEFLTQILHKFPLMQFVITVVSVSGDDDFPKAVLTLYRYIESKGTILKEFWNPNSRNMLRLVALNEQFERDYPPEQENDEEYDDDYGR